MPGYARSHGRFLADNARWLAGGFLLTMFSSFGQTFFIGLFGNDLRAAFDMSGGAFGGIYMAATLVSAMTLPWLGRTLDLMPGWKVVLFTVPALALACVMIAIAPNILVLTIAIYLLRLFGQGMMTEIALTEVGRWFVANRGRAMAIVVPGQQAGSAVLPAAVVLLERATGDWRMAWFAAAVLLLLVGLPVIVRLIRVDRIPLATPVGENDAAPVRDWTRQEVLRDPVLYLVLIGTLAPAFIGTVIFFQQGYLIDHRGYDPLAFASAFTLMSLTTVVFGYVCGDIVDRIGSIRLLPFLLVPLTLATVVVALVTPFWGVYVFMFLLGISNGFTATLHGALWPEVYGLENLGGIRAITVSGMVLASALGPGLTGILLDQGVSLTSQMLWMALWCCAATAGLAIAASIIRRRNADTPATARGTA